MKGGYVREHYQLRLDPREARALRRVSEDALADADFPLNEMEEETLEGLVDMLAEDEVATP